MLTYAAVCPHPPLLVPEMAGEAAPELDGVRAACRLAVQELTKGLSADGGGAKLIVVGGDTATRTFPPDSAGSLRPFGLDLVFGGGGEPLPLSLTIGRWLLDEYGGGVQPAFFQAVAYDAATRDCLDLGRDLARTAERVAFLVMGDGSACLSTKAPGYLDPRAEAYDAAVAEAFKHADTAALAGLDPRTSRELQAAGRAAWQVLAGATTPTGPARVTDAELLAYEAPYGVGYLVATWRLAAAPAPADTSRARP
ncbi:class III extradiol dioxygenase subunit B-like domain-containing protein [Actinomadura sp. SCN-SB]|uniref:class III extradiol dioxygenase subunit B-like domain-containing protein n=1 Tax=Actinomadura sp. SCN-SB TaxID=3373092 RepID=UPI003750FBF6